MMKKNNIDELVNSMKKYIQDPVLFVRNVLKVKPDKWQEECLQAIANNGRVAVRSGHGVGKTALESWVILWFLFTRPFPKIPCTAPTQQQLLDILWPEISKWLKRSELMDSLFDWQKTKIQNRIFPERWFATARTASKPENMAGFHEEHLLFVIDEASGVADQIYETIEGALTTKDAKLLLCGNPTKNFGVFKRAFFEDRYLYYTIKVNCMDTNRVASDYCQRLIRQYGMDSDVVRVRVLGEFPKSEPDGLIPLEIVEAAMMRDLDINYDSMLHIGADIARFGDDETTIVPRIGGKTLGLFHYTKQDTTTTAGKILSITTGFMRDYHKPFASICIDDDGVGGGVTDMLREKIYERNLNIEVVGCHNGGRANEPEHYANWITEQWCNLKQRLTDGDIELPQDDELSAQLSTRKYGINSKGQIVLEDKKTYKKRIHRSPDRADGLILAFAETKETDPNIAALLGGAKLYGNY
ncbi:MAG: terminase B [Megamonas funiformis]|nr:terminase B [Megamonas funiformis]